MSWIEFPLVEALGWTLLHSLWQVAAIALVLGTALRLLRRTPANVRYLACVAALGCAVVLWTATLLGQWKRPAPEALPAPAASVSAPPVAAPGPRVARAPMRTYIPYAVPFWLAGVMIAWCRTLAAGCAANRLRRVGVSPAPAAWQERLEMLAARMRLARPVRLLASLRVDAPMVLGLLRPVVLVPAGALAGLDPAQLQAILAHELAHVRRHDYLVNLAQRAVENLLFYHPAIWWISARIREERENACDEAAVDVTGDARTYVLALANLEESRHTAAGPALAATGGNLIRRVRRLLRQPDDRRPAGVPALVVAAIMAVALGATLAAWQAPHALAKSQAAAQSAAAPQPAPESHPAGTPQSSEASQPVAEPQLAKDPQPAADPLDGLAIMVDGDDWLHGWFNDADREQARRNARGRDWVWMRRAGKTYLIDDPRTILEAFNAYAKAGKCSSEIRQAESEAARLRALQGGWCEIPARELDAAGVQSLDALQAQLAKLQEELNRAGQERLMLETQLQNLKNERFFVTGPVTGRERRVGAEAKARLDALNRMILDIARALDEKRKTHPDNDPEIRAADNRLDTLRREYYLLMLGREPEPATANEEASSAQARLAQEARQLQALREARDKAMTDVQAKIQSKQQEIERQDRLLAELRGSTLQETTAAISALAMNRVWRVLDAAIADGRARRIR